MIVAEEPSPDTTTTATVSSSSYPSSSSTASASAAAAEDHPRARSSNYNGISSSSSSSSWESIRDAVRGYHSAPAAAAGQPSPMRDWVFDDAASRRRARREAMRTVSESCGSGSNRRRREEAPERILFLGLDPLHSPKATTLYYIEEPQQHHHHHNHHNNNHHYHNHNHATNEEEEDGKKNCGIGGGGGSNSSKVATASSWKPLLDSAWAVPSSEDLSSKEEQLLRERMRIGVHGIANYHFHVGWQLLVFPFGGSIYLVDVSEPAPCKPVELASKSSTSSLRLDPKIGGASRPFVSFLRDSDLWVYDIRNAVETRLTFAGEAPGVGCGVAEYVVQEEFHRFSGYFWAPTGEHQILFVEVDESQVEVVAIPSSGAEPKVDLYRYPRAGTANARATVNIVEFPTTSNLEGDAKLNPQVKSLYGSFALEARFPWYEYIPRLGWMPDGTGIWLQLLDRHHQRLALVVIPVEDFMTEEENASGDPNRFSKAQVLLEETSDIWINITDILYFLPEREKEKEKTEQGWETELSVSPMYRFIWASERTGFRHLYLVEVEKCQEYPIASCPWSPSFSTEAVFRRKPTRMSAITTGLWQIVDWPIAVNTEQSLVYFLAKKSTPLESQLYAASYGANRNPEDIRQLTADGFSHKTTFNSDGTLFLTMYSSVDVAPNVSVYSLEDGRRPVQLFSLMTPTKEVVDLPPFQFFQFRNRTQHTIYGGFYTPPNYVKGRSYPTLLKVYAGPHAQMVTNEYKFPRFMQLFLAAKMGYVVVIIDGRGSCNRGLEFESWLKGNFGSVELEDQVDGLVYLSKTYNLINMDRIAITGWSYGAFISLMALARYPNIFKICICGAPVTSWRLYDTAYTEKFLGTPAEHPETYEATSVLSHVDKFPDEANRLLVVHGLIDENVHFKNTELLVDALNHRQKPHLVHIFPNERHTIRHQDTNEHFETLMFYFLRNFL